MDRIRAIDRREVGVALLIAETALIVGLLALRLVTGERSFMVELVLGAVVLGGVAIASLAGWRSAPQAAVAAIAVLVGAGLPEPFVTSYAPLAVVVPPAIALAIAPTRWVVIATALTFAVLLARAGGEGVYTKADTIAIALMAALAMVASRLLADHDRRTALDAQKAVRELNEGLERRVRERTAALEEANREIEQVSYAVSHDLRAPLRAIDGFAHLLNEDEPNLSADTRRRLDLLGDAAKRMGHVLDDLVSFTELGRREPRRRRIDMGPTAQRCFETARAAQPTATATLRACADLGSCDADPQLVEILFVDLFENALRHARAPDATVTVGRVAAETTPTFFVQDSGDGFDMRYADSLFAVFSATHADGPEHTGIGLATVRRIVTRHGGRVWAESARSQGATFFFTLPNAAPPRSVDMRSGGSAAAAC